MVEATFLTQNILILFWTTHGSFHQGTWIFGLNMGSFLISHLLTINGVYRIVPCGGSSCSYSWGWWESSNLGIHGPEGVASVFHWKKAISPWCLCWHPCSGVMGVEVWSCTQKACYFLGTPENVFIFQLVQCIVFFPTHYSWSSWRCGSI